MPNFCENHLSITGDKAVLSRLKSQCLRPAEAGESSCDERDLIFDFNGIFPMPETLNTECGSRGHNSVALLKSSSDSLVKGTITDHVFQSLLVNDAFADKDLNRMTIGELIALLDQNPDLQPRLSLDLTMGRQQLRNIEQYGHPTWYEWRWDNWGTKWNACEAYINEEDNQLEVFFDTAWSPPEGVYRKLCADYPQLELVATYAEGGCFFAGTYTSDGEGGLIDSPCVTDEEISRFMHEEFGIEPLDDDEAA